jgi:Tetratricopeptide repeat
MGAAMLGESAVFAGSYAIAAMVLKEAAGICESLGDGPGHAQRLFLLGQIAGNQGRAEEARSLFERSSEIARKTDAQAGVAVAPRGRGPRSWLRATNPYGRLGDDQGGN